MELGIDKLEKKEARAQIYQVEFSVGDINYIYIGLDTKCDPEYFGSSLVIYHYQKVFGNSLFKKTILEDLTDISMTDLCSIEQRYIKESKRRSKSNNRHSINYTGQNRRDSSPPLDIPIIGKAIIKEAKKIGLELRMASLKLGIIKPTKPPSPFNKISGGGMHIETNNGLKRIGFSFLKERGNDNNLGLATNILRSLEFDNESIAITGSSKDYQLVMATHNSSDPVHIAGLYKRLINLVEVNSDLFTNDTNDQNKSLPKADIIDSQDVFLSGKKYTIKRYKKGYIRIIREGMDKPMPNSKHLLRKIDEEYNLSIDEKSWDQTQRAGKVIIEKLKEKL